MKCIKHIETNQMIRVPNKQAEQLVLTHQWVYVEKKEWKKTKRKENIIDSFEISKLKHSNN